MRLSLSFGAGLAALTLGTGLHAQPYDAASLPERLDQVIEKAIDHGRLVGAVVLVARDGELIYRRASGLADREAGRSMTEDTIFRLASMTKPIVSAAALRLAEQGHLGLQDPVTRWLPAFRPRLPNGATPTITLHHLLTHTAGLSYGFLEPDDGAYHRLGISDGLDQSGLSLEENLQRLAAAPLLFEPGTAWHYSLATDVLGAVVAEAGGGTLPQVVERLITGPLAMTDSAFTATEPERLAAAYVDHEPKPLRMGDSHVLRAEGLVLRFAPPRALDPDAFPSGGAGMVGTAGDFLRFLEMIRSGGGNLLTQATVDAMLQDQAAVTSQGPGWGFGYGWAVLTDPEAAGSPQSAGTIQWGGVYGHSWFVDPAAGLTVVALTNTALEGMAGNFPIAVRDAVYGVE